jgi:hypothetical protein
MMNGFSLAKDGNGLIEGYEGGRIERDVIPKAPQPKRGRGLGRSGLEPRVGHCAPGRSGRRF